MTLLRALWILLGLTALALGIIGVVLPLLPTTPFVILAAFCFAKSSPRLHDWLLAHRVFGPMIRDWNANGAIHPKAKTAAVISMAAVFGISLLLRVPLTVLGIQAVVLLGAATFVLSRPSPPER